MQPAAISSQKRAWGTGSRRGEQCSLCARCEGRRAHRPPSQLLAVLVPVLREPLHLLVAQVQLKWPIVKTGVLVIGGQLRRDVDASPRWFHREKSIVEEPVDVAAQHQTAMLMMLP